MSLRSERIMYTYVLLNSFDKLKCTVQNCALRLKQHHSSRREPENKAQSHPKGNAVLLAFV